MTGLPGYNFLAFNLAAACLRGAGYAVKNPADKGIIDGWTWVDYMKYDLGVLIHCDGVAALEGWQGSKGAKLEVYNAIKLEMPVDTVYGWLTRNSITLPSGKETK